MALQRAAIGTHQYRASELSERAIYRHAVEAVIWGMPAVNFQLMAQAAVNAAGAGYNQIVYWSRPVDWKNQTLTPNPDTIYLMPFINTQEGPVVLEIPPADDGTITGSIDDGWQTAIEDVGPAGVDKGKGGRYLILPPGHKGMTPAGYIPLQSSTFASYALLRSNLKDGGDHDIRRAVAYGKRVKLYPLSKAASPPPTKFTDAAETLFDSTIPYDLRFFRALDRFVQREPWLERDRAMIDPLKSIGIEKGKRFNPNRLTQDTLEEAIQEAHEWIELRYIDVFAPSFNEGRHWALPASPEFAEGIQTNFARPESYPVESRAVTYSMAFFSAKHLGEAQFYLMTIVDKDGRSLDGAANYRLTVPKDAPVRLYWSATAYDRATHALILDVPRASRGSNSPGLQTNADGSVDLWFGPKAPAGKETNWIPTDPRGGFEVLFRFYGPEKALFEKAWVLPDIEKVS